MHDELLSTIDVQKYVRTIHIMAMLLVGKVLSFTGRRKEPYTDAEEFIVE